MLLFHLEEINYQLDIIFCFCFFSAYFVYNYSVIISNHSFVGHYLDFPSHVVALTSSIYYMDRNFPWLQSIERNPIVKFFCNCSTIRSAVEKGRCVQIAITFYLQPPSPSRNSFYVKYIDCG